MFALLLATVRNMYVFFMGDTIAILVHMYIKDGERSGKRERVCGQV